MDQLIYPHSDNLLGINRNLLISLTVIWNLFLVATTAIFVMLRSNLSIKFRNVPLTVGGVLSTALCSNTYYIIILFPEKVPCYVVLWVMSLGAPFWFLTFFGKYILLAFSFQLARSKMRASNFSSQMAASATASNRSSHPDADLKGDIGLGKPSLETTTTTTLATSNNAIDRKWLGGAGALADVYSEVPQMELGRNWYHQNRNRWTTQSVLVCIVIVLGFHAVMAALTQWLTPEYNALAPPQLNCIKGVGMIPLFIMAILYFGIGGPLLALLMWRAKDAYLLKTELIYLVFSSAPFILLFFVFTYTPSLEAAFYPANFLICFHIFTHLSSIVLPAVDVYRNSLSKTPSNLEKFHQMLQDKDQFQDFKEFTVSDLTIENPLFYEEYMKFLMKYDPNFLTNQKQQHHSAHSDPASDVPRAIRQASKSLIPRFLYNRWMNLASTPDINSPHNNTYATGTSAASSDSRMKNRNTVPSFNLEDLMKYPPPTTSTSSSTFPINQTFPLTTTPGATVSNDEARDLIKLYDKFIAPGADYQLNLLGTTVRRIKQRMAMHDYDTHMLDQVLVEVLDSMYRNTFVRFIKSLQF